MIIGRLLGRLLLLAALAVLCRDLIGWYDLGAYLPASLGRLWSDLHAASLDQIADSASGWPGGAVFSTILGLPAALTFALLSVFPLWFCRRRYGRRRR